MLLTFYYSSSSVVDNTENQTSETTPVGSDARSNGIDRYFVDDVEEVPNLSSTSRATKNSSGDLSDKKSKHFSFIRKVKHIGKDLLHDDIRREEHETFFSFHKSKRNISGLIDWDEREEHRQGQPVQRPPGLDTQLRARRPSVTEMKAKVRETTRSNSFGYGVGGPSPPKPPPLVADRTAVDDLIEESSKEDFCPTCLEPYDAENPKIVAKCGHSYHLACLYEWLERSPYCPICAARMEFAEDTLNAIPEEET
ncbi:E3 ubiquitin-protein ligase At3g02290 [Galdieria sulphuraria]|nr:E3 ubiquitin-protein ligase At3g02290 [Galdieria sulphuraria]